MKKLNTLRVSFAAAFMFCFLAAAFVLTGVQAHAIQTVTGTITTLKVDANGDLCLDKVDSRYANELVVRVFSEQTVDGKTVPAGKYYFKNGKATMFTEAAKVVPMVAFKGTTYNPDKAFAKGTYTKGNPFVGKMDFYTGYLNGKVYKDADPYDGYYLDVNSNTLYYCTAGIPDAAKCNGVIEGTTYVDSVAKIKKNIPAGGFLVANGKMTTGFSGLRYYINGQTAAGKTGWEKINGNIYYFKAGVAVTGWYTLPSYGEGRKNYKYLFSDAGVLYTNLVDYYGWSNFIQKDIKIISNKTTHNTTFYIKDTSGYYNIPALTVICATARKKGDTPAGTFRLEKTWTKRWFVYTKTNGAPYRYYQWAVHIKGTASLYHSSTYRKKSATSLRVDLYNQLGKSVTTHCIRHQAKWAKLIYDIATKTNKKRRVPVQIITSKNEGPFGHVSLQKVSKGTKWDPTDPNKK